MSYHTFLREGHKPQNNTGRKWWFSCYDSHSENHGSYMTLKHGGKRKCNTFSNFHFIAHWVSISEAQGCQKIAKTVHAFLSASFQRTKTSVSIVIIRNEILRVKLSGVRADEGLNDGRILKALNNLLRYVLIRGQCQK